MEKNKNILKRFMWMFINIFGSNQKRLLMDHKRGSKRITGNIETCSYEILQKSVVDEKLIDDINTDVSVCKKDESEEKFREIIKRLIAQKEGEIQTCKDLLEAFHVLNASKRVVVVEEEEEKSEEAVLVMPKRRSKFFFSRKWRSEERRRNKSQIVVLKPSPDSVDIDRSGGNKKSKDVRNFSRFFIGFIKRRLQSSLGKKSCNDVIQSDKTKKLVSDIVEDDYSKKIMSGLYIAAKKHLSEMLANGDIDVNLPDKEVPRILGNILSLPEFSSPLDSPRLMTPGHDPGTQCSLATNDPVDEDDGTLITIDVSIPKDYVNQNEDIDKEEKVDIVPSFETCSLSVFQNVEFVNEEDVLEELHEEDGEKQSFNKEMTNHADLPSSPPSSSVRFIEECKETAIDVLSPVSILDPLFTDDDHDSSPRPRTRFSSAEMRIMQPLCIRFDETDDSPKQDNDNNNVKKSILDEDKESTLAYIETVVKSSGLSWEELLTRPFYSNQLLLLEPEQTDELVFYPTELCDDKNLLYDCINEVLMDFSKNEFNPGPWITFLKPEVQLTSDTEIAAKVAKEGVYWHLSPLPSPHTLDQIISKDMAKTGSWMDLRFEIDCIGSYTVEMILDELVEEIITSF